MLKKVYFILCTVLAINLACASEADYLVVDIEHVLSESNAAKNVQKQLEEKKKKYEDEIAKQENQLKADEGKLKKEQKTLSPEAFEKKVRSFQTKLAEVQRGIQMKRSNLEEMNIKGISKISEVASNVIKDIAEERKVKIVFPTSQILYADVSLDITVEVLKKVNQKLSKVTIE
ncbi:OmpH/Skp family outer membrane protein [Rickettsiales endosymbiont of Stachyamoeba lipophora]|uniref:OmpH family outer membrane protein n=1 Tax=Rickettsiales endosymbiont of Stachyamoeba lipophora TaxID=2486578 RepID=UPI000F64F24E|nr:OmpH family outer membrane protein [Rickettsiales endosymbiont of Stachyamoeba lipophora]AZL15777.1 OmpH family outer membrane protein [Rickettsiales endosymbiont of Stachyamoeba lipophora]